jgi:NAD-dependent dihydropyrimidine dehydrogenase PreA subunit
MQGWRIHLVLLLLLPAWPTTVASAAELYRTPSFSQHEIPQTQNPQPRPQWREYADMAALAAGLGLASYLALVRRSRRGLFLLAVVSLAWLGFWRKGCICPIGAIQNVTLAVCDPTYALPLSAVVFFALPIVVTLLCGRTFCAAVCPLGAVQEIVAVRPVKVPLWLEHSLGLLAYVYLGAAVVFAATDTAFVICRYDPFVALFRLSGGLNMLILGGCFLLVGLFVGRPYCRYLCPYGAILGLASRVAKWHVQIPPEECIKCRLCEDVCPYNAIREPTVAPAASQHRGGRRRLALLLLLLPGLVALGAATGLLLGPALARLHPTVHLAQRLRAEQAGRAEATTEASEAFRASGRSLESLYAEAADLTARLGRAGGWLGAWVGLVIGLKLIHLSVRRRRTDYQPDRTNCVSCGRCFWYCPGEQARQGWIQPPLPAVEGD